MSDWLWVLALLSLAAYAVASTRQTQLDLERRQRARAVSATEQAMELWERQVLDATSRWLSTIEDAPDPGTLEAQARAESSWVDAFYVWRTDTGEVLYPAPTPPLPGPGTRACLAEVEATAFLLPRSALATHYATCLPSTAAIETLAAEREARLLFQDGAVEEARLAIAAAPASRTLANGAEHGIPPGWLAAAVLTRARILVALGDAPQARAMLLDLAAEIERLDGPGLEPTLDAVGPPLLAALADLAPPQELAAGTAGLERARRRLDAWREVRDRLSRLADLPRSEGLPALLRDPYGTAPFLLLYRRMGTPGLAGAIQVDEAALVERLVEVIEEGAGVGVMVHDGALRRIGGASWGPSGQRQLTFPLVFEYLRVALAKPNAGVEPAERNRQLLSQLLPFAVAIALGALALAARGAAAREQIELETRRREFTTRVTHELKTPLAGIRVMAEALEIGAFRSDADRAELAQRILKESDRLSRRVDEVLDVTRAPSDLQREPTDLTALVREVTERWHDLMVQHGMDLKVRVQEDLSGMVERARLKDALGALLDNAIKYRNPTRAGRVELHARAAGRRWIVFEVIDNGLGVPADKRRVIFEPFTRVEGPGRGTAGGHGLGLSFVSNAARVHGGRVECREGIQGGARFILRIRR